MEIATSPFVCGGAAIFMPQKMGNLQGHGGKLRFEAVFQTVSSFFAIDRLAAIGEKMNILSAEATHLLTGL